MEDETRNSYAKTFAPIGAKMSKDKEREKDDYYATDPKAAYLLLELESFSKDIWECACGGGHISKVLEEKGYNVRSTDLVYRGYGEGGVDFLKTNETFDGDIITNPPYKYAAEFAQHAIETVGRDHKVAMFLKVLFLETQQRRRLFEKYPPRTVYVSSSRITCMLNGKPKRIQAHRHTHGIYGKKDIKGTRF